MSIVVYRLQKQEEGVFLRIVHVDQSTGHIEREGNTLIIDICIYYFVLLCTPPPSLSPVHPTREKQTHTKRNPEPTRYICLSGIFFFPHG